MSDQPNYEFDAKDLLEFSVALPKFERERSSDSETPLNTNPECIIAWETTLVQSEEFRKYLLKLLAEVSKSDLTGFRCDHGIYSQFITILNDTDYEEIGIFYEDSSLVAIVTFNPDEPVSVKNHKMQITNYFIQISGACNNSFNVLEEANLSPNQITHQQMFLWDSEKVK
jgi:hypothetical protein